MPAILAALAVAASLTVPAVPGTPASASGGCEPADVRVYMTSNGVGFAAADTAVAAALEEIGGDATGLCVTVGVEYHELASVAGSVTTAHYDVILLLMHGNWEDHEDFLAADGDVLTDFVAAGGGLVTGEWTSYNAAASGFAGSGWQQLDAILPVDRELGGPGLDVRLYRWDRTTNSRFDVGVAEDFILPWGDPEWTEISMFTPRVGAAVPYFSLFSRTVDAPPAARAFGREPGERDVSYDSVHAGVAAWDLSTTEGRGAAGSGRVVSFGPRLTAGDIAEVGGPNYSAHLRRLAANALLWASGLGEGLDPLAAAPPAPTPTYAQADVQDRVPTVVGGGELVVGATLQAPEVSWSNSPTSLSWKWQACTDWNWVPASCVEETTATDTLVIPAAFAGRGVRVVASATNAGGTGVASGVWRTGTVAAVPTDPDPVDGTGSAGSGSAGTGTDTGSETGTGTESGTVPGPAPTWIAGTDGRAPSLPSGAALVRLPDGTETPLTLVWDGDARVRLVVDTPGSIEATLSGAVRRGPSGEVVVDPDGEVSIELRGPVAAGTLDVWMFSTPRHLATVTVNDAAVQTFVLPLGAPADGGGPVAAGAHTLQLVVPTDHGMQAVDVALTVGSVAGTGAVPDAVSGEVSGVVSGPVPTGVPAGEGVRQAGSAGLALLLLLGAGVASLAQVERRRRTVEGGRAASR